ncbi:MAG TPA: hypothetical protein DEG86_08885, partial [Halieaceae bacterium]|nr:hypothetical protein [Halieaceae bacterium]
MRIDFCLTTLLGLPPQSRAPAIGDGFYIALQQAGFGGIQTETASAARDAGMVATAQVLSCDPAALDSIGERHA